MKDMRRFLFGIALMAMGSGLLTGCLSNNDDNKGSGSSELVVTKGALVLCGGNAVADVPSSLYYLDYEAGTSRAVASDLGADANDVIEYDGKVYVTGSGEDVIYVLSTDNFQLLDRISTTEEMGEEAGDSPRCLTAYDGKLYVTTRGGFVGIFDTNTRGYVNKIEVGKEPEGVYLDMKNNVPVLYVCCSGQPSIATVTLGATPSVTSFSNASIRQPMEVVAAGDMLFVRDFGYLDDQQLQKDAALYLIYGSAVEKLIPDATGMDAAGYSIVTYNDPIGKNAKPSYSVYNINGYGGYTNFPLSGDNSAPIQHPTVLSIDPNPYSGGNVMIGSESFVNIYRGSGVFAKSFPVGMEPCAVTYLYKTVKSSEIVNNQ